MLLLLYDLIFTVTFGLSFNFFNIDLVLHRDVMDHSFGPGYSTRSDEEGFGGVYGGNQTIIDKMTAKTNHHGKSLSLSLFETLVAHSFQNISGWALVRPDVDCQGA